MSIVHRRHTCPSFTQKATSMRSDLPELEHEAGIGPAFPQRSEVDAEPFPVPLDVEYPPDLISVKSLEDRYLQFHDMGSGSFGTVVLAEPAIGYLDCLLRKRSHKGTMLDCPESYQGNSSQFVAIKTMKRKLPRIADYVKIKEMKFIFAVSFHPQLVRIHDVFIDTETYHLRIVMEPMQQNLHQLMKSRQQPFSSITLKSITSQVLAGLRHIHRSSFFHRDVKPENILISHAGRFYGCKKNIPKNKRYDRFVVKLADYGLARNINSLRSYTSYVSTRWYRAPEILLRLGYYSLPIDVWAFGAVVAEIASFGPLFPGSDEMDQIFKVLQIVGSPTPPTFDDINRSDNTLFSPMGGFWNDADILFSKLGLKPKYFSGAHISQIVGNPELQQVIQRCLAWDPLKRATVEELSHMPYFKENSNLIETEQVFLRRTNKDRSLNNSLVLQYQDTLQLLNKTMEGDLKENISFHSQRDKKENARDSMSSDEAAAVDQRYDEDAYGNYKNTQVPKSRRGYDYDQDEPMTKFGNYGEFGSKGSAGLNQDKLEQVEVVSDPFLDESDFNFLGDISNPWKDLKDGKFDFFPNDNKYLHYDNVYADQN